VASLPTIATRIEKPLKRRDESIVNGAPCRAAAKLQKRPVGAAFLDRSTIG